MTDILKRFSNLILEKDKINIELYDKYNVKRGLRNSDGTGVLVGLTNIGNVHGYIMADDEKVPAEVLRGWSDWGRSCGFHSGRG